LGPLEVNADDSDEIGVEGDTDNELGDDEDPVLTEIEAWVVADDARIHA
jgi:hypothetical protein